MTERTKYFLIDVALFAMLGTSIFLIGLGWYWALLVGDATPEANTMTAARIWFSLGGVCLLAVIARSVLGLYQEWTQR